MDMGKNWFEIRVKTEPSAMKNVVSRIEGFQKEAADKYFFQMLQSISAAAADVGRQYIASAKVSTPTGEAAGRKGRIKSGDMQAGFKNDGGHKTGDGKYEFHFGWNDGTPGYSIFQELGTKNGITAMHALQYARQFAAAELKLRSKNAKAANFPASPTSFEG
jgi:hypothetical protein